MTAKAKIIVRQMFRDPGTTKSGKQYVKTVLITSEKSRYTTFENSSMVQEIKVGSKVELEFEKGKLENSFDIKKIILVDGTTQKPEARKQEANQQKPSPKNTITANLDQAKELANEWMAANADADYSLCHGLITAIFSAISGEQLSERIAKSKGVELPAS